MFRLRENEVGRLVPLMRVSRTSYGVDVANSRADCGPLRRCSLISCCEPSRIGVARFHTHQKLKRLIPGRLYNGSQFAHLPGMDCLRLSLVLALGVLGSVVGAAQDGAVNVIAAGAVNQRLSQVQMVDIGSYVERPSVLKFDVEAMMPSAVDGQIHFYGGPLQTLLNLANRDVARATHMSFGATFVLPVNRLRMELFGGMGGAFATFHTPYAMTNSWTVQTSMGARIALDPGRHIWVGTTANHVTDFADKKRQWVAGSADLTLRFGR
jgi:hypothetical protein